MKKNDIITLKITDINNLGYGVGHIGQGGLKGKTVFVNGAVSGEEVRAKIIKINTNFLVARLEEILVRSPHREENEGIDCSAPLACGGCVYRSITYAHELELKRNYVETAFKKAGLKNIEILPVLSAGSPLNYRNKAQYPVTKTKTGTAAGFYAAKTHKIIPNDNCNIQHKSFPEIVRFVCKFADENGIETYDETTHTGILKHIYLRAGEATEQIMLCLVINADSLPFAEKLVTETSNSFPEIKSIILNINKNKTNVVLGKTYKTLHGTDYIEDILCGLKFRITAEAFYQVNRKSAEILYREAIKLADFKGDETVFDLYCGIGTIGLCMADKVKTVVGAEIIESAVECAKANAEINGIKNAEFYCADATAPDLIETLAKLSEKTPDTVVLDPPRKGCSAELIESISNNRVKKVVYISCDPATLARDTALFISHGYNPSPVIPVDMFPRTGHVETVVLMSRVSGFEVTKNE